MFDENLDELSILLHPFYVKWNKGELTIENLQYYSGQYFHHVNAFPRYISTIHSKCESINDRQVLLDNLIDEEKGEENHPELWLQFSEGLGCDRQNVLHSEANDKTTKLVEGFFNLCNQSYASGLGALYAYERQVPQVAKSKLEGLKSFYQISDERTTKFFTVHMSADEWHSQEIEDLIQKLPETEIKIAKGSSIKAANLLWNFLDGVMAN